MQQGSSSSSSSGSSSNYANRQTRASIHASLLLWGVFGGTKPYPEAPTITPLDSTGASAGAGGNTTAFKLPDKSCPPKAVGPPKSPVSEANPNWVVCGNPKRCAATVATVRTKAKNTLNYRPWRWPLKMQTIEGWISLPGVPVRNAATRLKQSRTRTAPATSINKSINAAAAAAAAVGITGGITVSSGTSLKLHNPGSTGPVRPTECGPLSDPIRYASDQPSIARQFWQRQQSAVGAARTDDDHDDDDKRRPQRPPPSIKQRRKKVVQSPIDHIIIDVSHVFVFTEAVSSHPKRSSRVQ
ncbi:hypothetical protein AND_004224 [Anopheles darlingi]|uniref:Uncharacterized protein n=1 Tax=Anopheles darlingi TaxID=43151 RepID=W5JMQ3_ANODA|nr:hypothetical protein AND_004224 [Anopheles darlingi]